MPTYFFDVITDRDLTADADSDLVFEALGGDATPAVGNGTPMLMCSVEADTLDAAIRRVLAAMPSFGARAVRVEVEPETLAA